MKQSLFLVLAVNCIYVNLLGQIKSNNVNSFIDFECNAPLITLFKCDAGWLPKGGDEDNFIEITASSNNSDLMGTFFFHLFDVSSEVGFCMNGPSKDIQLPIGVQDSDTWKDLQFSPEPGFSYPQVVGDYSSIQTIGQPVSSATIKINCFDYGARGKIRVFFRPAGSQELIPAFEEQSDPNKAYTTIPLDMDENGIPDNAPFNLNNGLVTDDKDNVPAGSIFQLGDGLTRYEEYRGFMITSNGISVHKRLSADKKDVFIYSTVNEIVESGSFTSDNLTAEVHYVSDNQFDILSRVINYRYDLLNNYQHVDQKIVVVLGAYEIPANLLDLDYWGKAGFTNPLTGEVLDPSLWSPNTVYSPAYVVVDLIRHGITLRENVILGVDNFYCNECPYQQSGFNFCISYKNDGFTQLETESFQYSNFNILTGNFSTVNNGNGIVNSHSAGSKINYFLHENEVIDVVFTHEACHVVGLVHEICNQNVMCTPLEGGSTLNNGYYLSIIGNNPNALFHLRIK
jgi:hypothetical protein